MSFTIAQGRLNSVPIQSILTDFIKHSPLVKSISFVHSTSSHIPYPKESNYIKLNDYKEVSKLLQHAITSPSYYIKAIPTRQLNYSELLDVTNILEYKNGNLKLILTQSSFQTAPSLAQIATAVKKLPHTKIGHGSKNLVSYSHSITFENVSTLPSILIHVLDSIFGDCSIDLVSYNVDLQNLNLQASSIGSILVKDINPKISEPGQIEMDDLYEYLCLLHLNSDQLVENSVDPYLSSYSVEGSSKNESLQVSQFENIHSFSIPDLTALDYKSLSINTKLGHLLIHRSDKVTVWRT